MSEIDALLERCCREVPTALGAAIIEVGTASAVAVTAADEALDLVGMAPALSEVARRHRSALEALGGGPPGQSEDLILTTSRGSLLLHVFGESEERSFLLVLAAGRAANPGMARLVLASYEGRLLEALR
jgi:hypothetical protein